MLLGKLGYRNLWRNRRRTLLTMTAMSTATALVIIMLSVYDGMLWDMINSATLMYHGHVKITAPGYIDDHKIQQTLQENGIQKKLAGRSGIAGITGRTRAFALLSVGTGETAHTQPAELLGIVPETEKQVTLMHKHLREGTFISSQDSHDIVLGRGLAKRLEASVGDEVVAMGQGSDGSIAADLFTVTGIVATNDPIRDMSLALVGCQTLQNLMVLGDGLHEIVMTLDRPLAAETWAQELQTELPDVDVSSWYEFIPQMAEVLKNWDAFKYIFSLIFYFAVLLVAANTMYMAFFERIREFGIMCAIGLKTLRLAGMIMLEGLFMSGISGLVGGIAGLAGSWLLMVRPIDLSAFLTEITYAGTAMQPRITGYLTVSSVVIPIAMLTVLGVIVALFPAARLRKLRPVDVLREV